MTISVNTAETDRIRRTDQVSIQPLWIEAIEGPGKGARAPLVTGTLTVGSSSQCGLVIQDRSVSRQHVSVELEPGGVHIRDLGSRNGTYYLLARVSEARVPVGGSIQIGWTRLRFMPMKEKQVPTSERTGLCGLVGQSLAMRQLFSVLEKLGPAGSNVLLRGETGVGKDAVARAIHALSPRAQKPFVVFDCASVNPNLIESELFGHARGAFTGADQSRMGAIERAEGGTLFLDEVGELHPELQPKLLRMLEAREYQRVGDGKRREANVRVLAATHRDLEVEAKAGRFRPDLYYRLAVTTVDVPPLRNRPEDIPPLVAHFSRQICGLEVELEPSTLAALQCDPWPGNVRELRNAVERVLALGGPQAAPLANAEPGMAPSFKEAREQTLERFERDYLASILSRHRSLAAAARASKLSRGHLYRLIEKYGLQPPAAANQQRFDEAATPDPAAEREDTQP